MKNLLNGHYNGVNPSTNNYKSSSLLSILSNMLYSVNSNENHSNYYFFIL